MMQMLRSLRNLSLYLAKCLSIFISEVLIDCSWMCIVVVNENDVFFVEGDDDDGKSDQSDGYHSDQTA